MFGRTIVIWLVLLVLALAVVTFMSRLVEKYRLADRFSRVREKPSLSPKAAHLVLKRQLTGRPSGTCRLLWVKKTIAMQADLAPPYEASTNMDHAKSLSIDKTAR